MTWLKVADERSSECEPSASIDVEEMMHGTLKKIPEGARILVADARKAILLCNDGDQMYPDLRVHEVLNAEPNPPTREQGSDRPGRAVFQGQAGAGGAPRSSAVEQTDWHEQAEDRFAAQALEMLLRDRESEPLVLVAPPNFLAALRRRIPEKLRPAILAELDKDLTKIPSHEIERHLVG